MSDHYGERPLDETAAIGWAIYHKALSDRRGFRDDQLGIPSDDDVWLEIFAAIGEAARAVLSDAAAPK